MVAESARLREVLVKRGKVIAIREQDVGSLVVYYVRPVTGTIFPRELLVSWILVTLGSTDDLEEYAGVRLYLPPMGDLVREQECYLDLDEVDEFIVGIDFVASTRNSLSESLPERRELYYSSREDARIGVYKRPGESTTIPYISLTTGGEINLFTTTKILASEQSSALSALEGEEFALIRSLVASALSQLKDLRQK
jgi:hypothetical protein